MRAVYNTIDAYAESTGAAFLLVHHSSKGLQNEKSVTDVGSGAGAIARAADVHLIVRAHEDADCAVLECRVRSSAQPDPVGLRWAYPLWTPDPAIDVTRLAAKPRRPKRAEIADDRGTPGYMAVVSCATADPRPLGWFSARATAGKDHVARSLLRQACAVGALHLWPAKTARHPDRWALAPPTLE
jgi:hypothetical protein